MIGRPFKKGNIYGFKKGYIPWNKGKKMSDATKLKMSIFKKGKPIPWRDKIDNSGEKHYRWNPNREEVIRGIRHGTEYIKWRNSVLSRDNSKCRIDNCECSGSLEVHHILSWKDHPELRYSLNNGITLCHFHHPKRREEEKRLSPYFQDLMSVSRE